MQLNQGFATQTDKALEASCGAADISMRGARLIRIFASAVYHLPAANAVARIARCTSEQSATRIRTSLAVTRWLTDEHDFPTVRPLPLEQPIVTHGCVVTFWHYLPQDNNKYISAGVLGSLLRKLHRLPNPPVDLPAYRPLLSVRRAITHSHAISEEDRDWLSEYCDQLHNSYKKLEFQLPPGMIHGDAWRGNVLHNGSDAVLADWDAVSIGPREIDHLPTLQAAARFGLSEEQRDAFTSAIGYDVTSWSGYSTLLAMRELSTLTALLLNGHSDARSYRELFRRLTSIRNDDNHQWTTF